MNMESQIQYVNVDLIIPNRFQPRLRFDEKALTELSQSIKEHGIIQPIVVRRLGDKYEIIAGERRYKAAIIAGLTEVPVIVSNMNDEKSIEVAVLENIQRKNLSSIEEAKSYKKILDKGYLTQENLAKRLGVSQSTIANKLRLLNLSEKVQNALMNEKISERHARSLLQIENEQEQNELLDRIIFERMTVKQLDDFIKEKNNNQSFDFLKDNSNNSIEQTINSEFSDIFNNDISLDVDELDTIFKSPYNDNETILEDNNNVSQTEVLDVDDIFENKEITLDNELEDKDEFSGLFNIFNQDSYPSLEEEETNLDTGNNEFFNSLDIEKEETVEINPEPRVETIIKEEFPIISGDLNSVKVAINGLVEKIQKAGFKIANEDYDFEDIYQLIIKINK